MWARYAFWRAGQQEQGLRLRPVVHNYVRRVA